MPFPLPFPLPCFDRKPPLFDDLLFLLFEDVLESLLLEPFFDDRLLLLELLFFFLPLLPFSKNINSVGKALSLGSAVGTATGGVTGAGTGARVGGDWGALTGARVGEGVGGATGDGTGGVMVGLSVGRGVEPVVGRSVGRTTGVVGDAVGNGRDVGIRVGSVTLLAIGVMVGWTVVVWFREGCPVSSPITGGFVWTISITGAAVGIDPDTGIVVGTVIDVVGTTVGEGSGPLVSVPLPSGVSVGSVAGVCVGDELLGSVVGFIVPVV